MCSKDFGQIPRIENLLPEFERICKNHGTDKILFASDFPWHKASMEKELIESTSLSDEEKKKIFGENARKLLKI